jgi:hypothetical protein
MSKRLPDAQPKRKRGRYTAAKYLPEVKQLVAQLFVAARDDGMMPAQFSSWLEKASTPVPTRTLLDWAATARAGLPVISPTKKTGALAIATTLQTAVLCGFVLHQNAKHVEVSRQDGADFMFDQFGLDLANRTIGDIYAKADLTRRRMRLRTSGYMLTEDELTDMYVTYVNELRVAGALSGTFASLDFTTTRHQVGSRFSYGASGSGSLKNRRKTTSHTNNLLTCVLQDGSQVPCLLYWSGSSIPTAWTGNVTLVVDSMSSTPLYMNISSISSWVFSEFSTKPTTYQPDDSIYDLPAKFFAGKTVRTPNVTTVSFYRSFTVDRFARYLINDNAATSTGEAEWICSKTTPQLVFAQFDVEIDTNFGTYAMCNKGYCSCGSLPSCQAIGESGGDPTVRNFWYSFPASAMCASGFPIGTNNCSWSADYVLQKAITMPCMLSTMDPSFPAGYKCNSAQYGLAGKHIELAFASCPDVKDTLPFAWNV